MRPYPFVPRSMYRSIRAASGGTIDSASLWNTLVERGRWIERNKLRASGWASGPDSADGVIDAVGNYDFGTFILPSVADPHQKINVYLFVAYTAAGVTYYAELMTHFDGRWKSAQPAEEVGTPSDSGWITASLDVTTDDRGLYGALGVRITAVATGTPDQILASVSILSDTAGNDSNGATPDAAFATLSLDHVSDADRPDDVYTLDRLVRQQDHIACRYPRTLGAHAIGSNVASGVDGLLIWYCFGAGARDAGCDVYVYAKTSSATGGTLKSRVMDHSDAPALAGTETAVDVTSTTGAWHTFSFTGGILTPNGLGDLIIGANGKTDGETYDDVTIMAVVVIERENDKDVRADDAEAIADAVVFPVYRAGDPVVADYSTGAIDLHSDRLTLAQNNQYQGLRRTQLAVMDYLDRDAATQENSTTAAYFSAATLWRTKHYAGYGARSVSVTGAFRRTGTSSPRAWLKFALYLDATLADERVFGLDDTLPLTWDLGTADVTEATTYEVSIRAGWVSEQGNSFSGVTDAIVLDAVMLHESPVVLAD